MHFDAFLETVRTFLATGDPGVRVLVAPPGCEPAEPAGPLFEACRRDSRAPALLLTAHPGDLVELMDSDDGQGRLLDALPKRFEVQDLPGVIADLGRAPTLILAHAEALTFNALADLLGRIRGLVPRGCRVKVFLCGTFTVQSCIQSWSRQLAFQSSPFGGKNFWLEGYSAEQIGAKLSRLVTGVPKDHLDILVEMIVHHTGKDRRFVDYLMNLLQDDPPPAGPHGLQAVEHGLSALAGQMPVQDLVWDTLADLPEPAMAMLEAALRYQMVRLDDQDLACEALAVRGLFCAPGPRGAFNWQPASPLVATILRAQWAFRFPGARQFPPEAEMISTTLPVAPPAQALVTRIENTLRNLLLLTFAVNSQGHPLELAPAVKKASLLGKAALMRDADAESYRTCLLNRPLTSFLEIGDLAAVFDNSGIYTEYFEGIFPGREQLAIWFEEFTLLRNAVAHNKVLSIKVLDDLSRQLEFIETHLGLAAAKRLKGNVSKEVEQDRVTLVTSAKGPGGKILGWLSAGRRLEADVRGQAFDAEGGKLLSKVQRVFLEPDQPKHVELSLEPGLQPVQEGAFRIEVVWAGPRMT